MHIGDSVVVAENTAISTLSPLGKPVASDAAVVGDSGVGAAFYDPEMDELEDDDPARLQQSLIYSMAGFNVSTSSVSTLASEVYSSDGSEPAFGEEPDPEAAGKESFHADAVHGLLDALVANQWQDSKVLLNSAPAVGNGIGLELLAPAGDGRVRAAIGASVATRAGAVPAQKAQLYPANGHAGVSAATLQLATPLGGDALAVTVTWRDAGGDHRADLDLLPGHRAILLNTDGTAVPR